MSIFLQAIGLIFMAEMGDKTQLLAFAFATQFSIKEVLLGVAIGVGFNHGLAVIIGTYLSNLLSMNMINAIAGLLFVAFGIVSLKSEENDEEEKIHKHLGAIGTVAIAFFIGELGDKTQLTAIALSVDAKSPLLVLLGTVSGMLLISAMGIFVGNKMGNVCKGMVIKILAACIFMICGIIKLCHVDYTHSSQLFIMIMSVALLGYIFYPSITKIFRKSSATKHS